MSEESLYLMTPLTMRIPNSKGIYAVSKLRDPKMLSISEFMFYTCKQILVRFEPDGISAPVPVDAYGRGLDCWYLAEFVPSPALRQKHEAKQ